MTNAKIFGYRILVTWYHYVYEKRDQSPNINLLVNSLQPTSNLCASQSSKQLVTTAAHRYYTIANLISCIGLDR